MGLALHCHEEHKLTNGIMEENKDIERKKELLPQALPELQALQKMFSRASYIQICLPLKQTRRNRLNLPNQHNCHSTLSPHHSTLSAS